ncbi:MAG: type IVB secretion system protein IcmH/DotU [Pseudomonadota bacterium]
MTADQDDPFAEPGDTDRTVIRPNPGGRRPLATPAPAPEAPRAEPTAARAGSDKDVSVALTGMNPLNAAAATLFSLIGRIRNRAQHPDPDALRRSVVAEVRAFEARALQDKIDPAAIKVARYTICATIDDVVLNTPWGGASQWSQQSMVATFHRETVGGDRFYDLLARLEKDPAGNIDMLEFVYMCLSLGFEGRLRVDKDGRDKHQDIRAGLARIIRTYRGDLDRSLSPHWRGQDAPHRALSAWKPFWISVAAITAMLAAGFFVLSYLLNAQTQNIVGQLSVLDPGGVATLERRAPPVIAPPPPSQDDLLKKVEEFLKPEIDEGLVEVLTDAQAITVRIAGAGMFKPASDQLVDSFRTPLDRVARALVDTNGPIIIAGHSDSTPLSSRRFASNMALSLARAESVRKEIASVFGDGAARLTPEGRSDKEPIATNATREGRAKNRRIELVLVREEQT